MKELPMLFCVNTDLFQQVFGHAVGGAHLAICVTSIADRVEPVSQRLVRKKGGCGGFIERENVAHCRTSVEAAGGSE